MKAIIVEDNPSAANVVRLFLQEYPGPISLAGVAHTFSEARKIIADHRPDLWLLDIRIQDKLVFSLLEEMKEYLGEGVSLVFLTGYYESDYLHEALRLSALDYIVKPVDRDLLFAALDKAGERASRTDIVARISRLEENVRQIRSQGNAQRIPIHRVNGDIDYIEKEDVIYFVTEDNVTRVMLGSGKILATTRLLKVYEEMLEGKGAFLRISKQVILNLDYVASFNPRTNTVMLVNGTSLQVSRRKASRLVDVLSSL